MRPDSLLVLSVVVGRQWHISSLCHCAVNRQNALSSSSSPSIYIRLVIFQICVVVIVVASTYLSPSLISSSSSHLVSLSSLSLLSLYLPLPNSHQRNINVFLSLSLHSDRERILLIINIHHIVISLIVASLIPPASSEYCILCCWEGTAYRHH